MARPNHLGLLPFFLTVKPFAYVVRYYTCQNGKDKGNEKFHYAYLLPVASIGNGNSLIIAYIRLVVYGDNTKIRKVYLLNIISTYRNLEKILF